MRSDKKKRLEARGWTVGDAEDFLALSDAEAAYVELKLRLARAVREHRTRRELTQSQLAEHIGSSQSRVAKMEAADPTVSLDLLVRTLLAMGITNAGLGHLLGPAADLPPDVRRLTERRVPEVDDP